MRDEPVEPFRILTVCTGNICRSPLMERLLAAKLGERFDDAAAAVSVRSAGTWGHDGAPMEAFAAACLTDLGGTAAGFVARELDAAMALRSDLILTASREHRAAVVTMAPATSRRCFTLLEFDRLLSPVESLETAATDLPGRLHALVEAAAANRGLVPPQRPGDDDIEDPYGAPQRVFTRVATLINGSLRRPVGLLAGTVGS